MRICSRKASMMMMMVTTNGNTLLAVFLLVILISMVVADEFIHFCQRDLTGLLLNKEDALEQIVI